MRCAGLRHPMPLAFSLWRYEDHGGATATKRGETSDFGSSCTMFVRSFLCSERVWLMDAPTLVGGDDHGS